MDACCPVPSVARYASGFATELTARACSAVSQEGAAGALGVDAFPVWDSPGAIALPRGSSQRVCDGSLAAQLGGALRRAISVGRAVQRSFSSAPAAQRQSTGPALLCTPQSG